MEFVELTVEEFRSFALNHPNASFLQTPEMAQIRCNLGWEKHFLGVKRDDKILAGAMIVSKKSHFGKYEFYSPHGLLVDYLDYSLLSFFTKNLKKYLKKHNAYILRIDPYYPLIERDINGDIVKDGYDNTKAIDNLLKLGYKKSKTLMQLFNFSFVLDLDIDADTLWKRMRTFTKRNITKAKKNGIVIKDVTYEDLPLLKNVIDSTSNRKNFNNRTLSYYQDLYKQFMERGEIKFLLGELHLKDYIERIKKEISELEEHLLTLEKQNAKDEKKDKCKADILKNKTLLEEAKGLREKEGEILILSGGVFLLYGTEVLYLFGGNYEEYMKFGASYLMQWEMINYGIDNGYKRYNFYGISSNFDKNDKDYGVYEFKKGFTGYVEQTIGDYILPVGPIYYVVSLLKKVKNIIKR